MKVYWTTTNTIIVLTLLPFLTLLPPHNSSLSYYYSSNSSGVFDNFFFPLIGVNRQNVVNTSNFFSFELYLKKKKKNYLRTIFCFLFLKNYFSFQLTKHVKGAFLGSLVGPNLISRNEPFPKARVEIRESYAWSYLKEDMICISRSICTQAKIPKQPRNNISKVQAIKY